MAKTKTQPELRFAGFTEDWIPSKLGNIGEVKMCKRIFNNQTSPKGDIPFYKIGTFGKKADSYISKELYQEFRNKYPFPKEGDILLSASGTLGRIVVYDGKPAYFQDSNIVWLNHNESKILNIFLCHIYGNITFESEGGTIQRLYNSIILNSRFSYPISKTEQKQIGNFFETLDKLITEHQQKHTKLKSIKQAMLDKMFPKQGQTVPEIRFKGFEGDWEERPLGKIFNYERPDNYLVLSEEYSDEFKTPVLTANKAFILGYTNETRTFNEPCIIFDDFTLDNKYVDFPFMVKSSALKILTIQNKITDDIMFSFFNLSNQKIEIMGHARHYISVVQKTNVLVPSISEQKMIGKYFKNLDELIDNHETQITKLQNIKKALLAKMFI